MHYKADSFFTMVENTDDMIQRSDLVIVQTALVSSLLLAWLPLLGHTWLVADDFAYIRLSEGGWSAYVAALGAWRPLGQHVPAMAYLFHPAAPAILALFTHVAATLLLFHVSRALFNGMWLPFSLALVFGVFPFGYEALVWLIAYNFMLPVALFLANFWIILKAEPKPIVYVASAMLALGSALGNEALFFASIVCGVFALPRSRCLALAPLAGCTVWFILHWYGQQQSADPGRTPTFNAYALVSTYWHQYSLLDVFQPWRSSVCRNLLFFGWNPLTVTGVTLSGLIMAICLWRFPPEPCASKSGWRLFGLLGVILLGASFIYVLNGGFSLDARKKYPLLPLLLLAAGWGWRRWGFHLHRVALLAGAFVVIALGAATTWLIIGIWKHEAQVYNHLADQVVARNITSIAIHRDPDLHDAWPTFGRSLGFRFDDGWVLNLAVAYRGGTPLIITDDAQVTALYEPVSDKWIFRETIPSHLP